MDTKIKLWMNRNSLNRKMLEEAFEIVEDINKAEYFLCWTWIPEDVTSHPEKLKKTIYVAYEVPLTGHVFYCYTLLDKLHTAVVYSVDPAKSNQIPMSFNPLYFPVNPFFENDLDLGEIKEINNKIFYAGARCFGIYNDVPELFGVNAKEDRDKLACEILKRKKGTIVGEGWPLKTKYPDDKMSWRKRKILDTKEANCSYHLCFENYLMPGLISERLHDGFSSDRVILYLGDPQIDRWLPNDCYIDLRQFFDGKNHKFDHEAFFNKIDSITLEEYSAILNNARTLRKSMDREGFIKERDKITKLIINRIYGKKD